MPNKDKNTEIPQCVQPAVRGSDLLIGKAKTDFEDWFVKKEQQTIDTGKTIILIFFYALTETMRNAEIIEWLDSVHLYINTKPKTNNIDFFKWQFSIRNYKNTPYVFYSRKEAHFEAIIEANAIYNARFIDSN